MGHLFLSYSRRDRERVRSVRNQLEAMNVRTFFDESNLRAGRNWPHALEQALRDSIGVAVFVGQEIGNWQRAEIGFALDRQVTETAFPVVPILLDGTDTTRSFLFLNTWLDMRGEKFGDRCQRPDITRSRCTTVTSI
jgi:TIR domain